MLKKGKHSSLFVVSLSYEKKKTFYKIYNLLNPFKYLYCTKLFWWDRKIKSKWMNLKAAWHSVYCHFVYWHFVRSHLVCGECSCKFECCVTIRCVMTWEADCRRYVCRWNVCRGNGMLPNWWGIEKAGKPNRRELLLITVDLLVLTYLDLLLLKLKILFALFTKQATLMRRPTVLSLPLQLVFLARRSTLSRHSAWWHSAQL